MDIVFLVRTTENSTSEKMMSLPLRPEVDHEYRARPKEHGGEADCLHYCKDEEEVEEIRTSKKEEEPQE